MAKTNWDMDDTVTPADLNQIGQEINTSTGQLTSHVGAGGGAHAAATTSTAGFMSSADKTKLNGVATGAGTANSATDTVIGNRTVSDATAPTSDTGTLTGLLSGIVYMIKAVTGGATWRTLPGMSLAAIKTILDAATNVATASTLLKRDSSGRAKVAAPSAADDIARKAEVDAAISATDTVQTSLTGHIGSGGTAHALSTTNTAGFMSTADKSKLDGVAAGANNYTHPTSDGNQHVPATGTTNSGKVLKAGATTGSAAWSTLTKSDISDFPASLPASGGDADTVDGYHLNQDVRSTASPSFARAILTQANGTAPMAVTSQTVVGNLNADMVDGLHAATAVSANTIAARDGDSDIYANRLRSTVAAGVSPLVVVSPTVVTNLNADMVDGLHSSDLVTAVIALASGVDLDTILKSGFYRLGSSPVNAPSGADYAQMIVSRGQDTIMQQIFRYSAAAGNGHIWVRRGNPPSVGGTNVWSGWHKVWNSDSQGAGSGMDSDLLDGKQSAYDATPFTVPTRGEEGEVVAYRFDSTVPNGPNPPITVLSSTMVRNLNVEYLGGYRYDDYTRRTDYGRLTGYAVASGSLAYTLTLSPPAPGYADGMAVAFKIGTTNSAANPTLNVNGLGSRTIYDGDGTALAAGALKANSIYSARYNLSTSSFYLQGKGGEKGAKYVLYDSVSAIITGSGTMSAEKKYTFNSADLVAALQNPTGFIAQYGNLGQHTLTGYGTVPFPANGALSGPENNVNTIFNITQTGSPNQKLFVAWVLYTIMSATEVVFTIQVSSTLYNIVPPTSTNLRIGIIKL